MSDNMNDKKRIKICIFISVFILAAIVVTHFCLGHYLRTAHLINSKFAYYSGLILPEPMPIEEAKEKYPKAFEPAGYNRGKRPLKETDARKVLIAADIVLAGTGIFIILFYLSFTAPNPSRRRVLLSLFFVFVAGALLLFFFIYMHFSDITYIEKEGGPEIMYASLGDSLTG